jgi:hypothetical protein
MSIPQWLQDDIFISFSAKSVPGGNRKAHTCRPKVNTTNSLYGSMGMPRGIPNRAHP